MSVAVARYETIVYPMNRHKGYGTPVTVYASTKQEAINKAVTIGWGGYDRDARVSVESVTEVHAAPNPDVS
jgi:hypothetical protein